MAHNTTASSGTPSNLLETILTRLAAKKRGDRWQASCPTHDDKKASLSIGRGADDKILLFCHAGCSFAAIANALGFTPRELSMLSPGRTSFQVKMMNSGQKARVVASYDYRDEQGQLLFQVQRKADKSFICCKPDGKDGWLYKLGNTRRVLYLLPELLSADAGATVFLCEGEKDVDRLCALGLVATTNPHGAGKWRDEYNAFLKGREVVILPDNDDAGREHAKTVATALEGIAASVRVLELPNLPDKGDVTDWLDAGGDAEQLCILAENAPEWTAAKADTLQTAIATANALAVMTTNKSGKAIELALARARFFHNEEGETFASVRVDEHQETYALSSRRFKTWLIGAYFERYAEALYGEVLSQALATLNAIALYKGEQQEVGTRVMEHNGNIYLDLGDGTWRVVEITKQGYRVLEAQDAPVNFCRTQGMQALPEPTRGGKLTDLKKFLNKNIDDGAWALVAGWLVMTLHPSGPYPLLSISGEQGSAKSTASRVLRALIDPNKAPTRAKPKEERDLMIAASNSRIVAFDNLSGLAQELADALCRIATGAGYSARTLHTDREETIFSLCRPLILNGINENSEFPDLLDRAVSVWLPAIPESERRDEREFWAAFEAARPGILGALLSAVSQALKGYESVTLERKPRMADFAKWAVAAEPALGLASGQFINAYTGNREVASAISLDVSPAKEIREWVNRNGISHWSGKTSDLLSELNKMLSDQNEDPAKKLRWPKASHTFSGQLNRVTPNLRAAGIDIRVSRTKEGSITEINVSPPNLGKQASPASPTL